MSPESDGNMLECMLYRSSMRDQENEFESLSAAAAPAGRQPGILFIKKKKKKRPNKHQLDDVNTYLKSLLS